MGEGVCFGVPEFPLWAAPSKKYQELFNKVSKELGYDLVWKKDLPDQGTPNVPDLYLGEVEHKGLVAPQEALCHVMFTIESRRQEVSKAAHEQFILIPTDTPNRMEHLAPDEKRWLQDVVPQLATISSHIWGEQNSATYHQKFGWVLENQEALDRASFAHYFKLKASGLPNVEDPSSLERFEYHDYATSLPWFPEESPYGAMLPEGITEFEVSYVAKTYSENDPIMLPYTVVEYATATDVERIRTSPKFNETGHQLEFVYEGKKEDGTTVFYKVTNIAHHKTFKPYFESAAKLIEENIYEGLHPEFQAYLKTMVTTFRTGDFPVLLQADLNQTKGNITFTFYPHEGYWKGFKYPFMMNAMVRQAIPAEKAMKEVRYGQELENITADILQGMGLEYEAREFNVEEAKKAGEFGWSYQSGGFLRHFPRGEAAGHDFPKRSYKGIEGYKDVLGHKTVTILDTIYGTFGMRQKQMQILFKDGTDRLLTFESSADFVPGHESTHGTGLRPESLTLKTVCDEDGKCQNLKLVDAFKDYYWLLGEPLADAGSYVKFGLEKNLIQYSKDENGRVFVAKTPGVKLDAESMEKVVSYVEWLFFRTIPSKYGLVEELMKTEPHYVGNVMELAWLASKGVLSIGKEKELVVKWDDVVPAMAELHLKLTEFTARGDEAAFAAFHKKMVASMPKDVEGIICASKAAAKKPYYLIRNGDRL